MEHLGDPLGVVRVKNLVKAVGVLVMCKPAPRQLAGEQEIDAEGQTRDHHNHNASYAGPIGRTPRAQRDPASPALLFRPSPGLSKKRYR